LQELYDYFAEQKQDESDHNNQFRRHSYNTQIQNQQIVDPNFGQFQPRQLYKSNRACRVELSDQKKTLSQERHRTKCGSPKNQRPGVLNFFFRTKLKHRSYKGKCCQKLSFSRSNFQCRFIEPTGKTNCLSDCLKTKISNPVNFPLKAPQSSLVKKENFSKDITEGSSGSRDDQFKFVEGLIRPFNVHSTQLFKKKSTNILFSHISRSKREFNIHQKCQTQTFDDFSSKKKGKLVSIQYYSTYSSMQNKK